MLKIRLSQILYCAEKKISEWEFRGGGVSLLVPRFRTPLTKCTVKDAPFLVWAIIKCSHVVYNDFFWYFIIMLPVFVYY